MRLIFSPFLQGCKIEWFHYECVGLTEDSVLPDKWYCPECTDQMQKSAEAEQSTGEIEEKEKEKAEKSNNKPMVN